jgi:hypothetical protein
MRFTNHSPMTLSVHRTLHYLTEHVEHIASFYLIMFCIWSLLQYLHFLYSFISNPAHLGGVLDTTLYHQFCQRLSACRRFFPNTPVSSTNKTDRHDKTEVERYRKNWALDTQGRETKQNHNKET